VPPEAARPTVFSRPRVLGALAAPAWLAFAGSLVGAVYLLRWVLTVLHECVGHGLAAELVGGRFESFVVYPNLSGWASYAEVPPTREWVVAWGGIALEGGLGLVGLWAYRRAPRPMSARALALFVLTAVGLGGALAYTLQGALSGRGDAAQLAQTLAPAPRVLLIVALVAGLLALLRWVVSNVLRWSEEQFAPADARQRAACYLLAVVVPLALTFALLPRNTVFPVWQQIAVTGTELLLLAGYGAFRARRAPPDADVANPSRATVPMALGWLAAAAAALTISTVRLSTPVRVHDRPVPLAETRERPLVTHVPRFPRTRRAEGLLGAPARLARAPFETRDLRFAHGPDGAPALWHGVEGRYAALDEVLARRGEFLVPGGGGFATWVPQRGGEPLLLVSTAEESHATLTGFQGGTERRWSWRSPERNLDAPWSVLFDDEGPTGVVIGAGGATGLVALDLAGRELWRLPREFVAYEVHTHSRLPGFILHIGGDALLLAEEPGSKEPRVALGGREHRDRFYAATYVITAALFPDSSGRPALVLVGSDPPILVRVDAEGRDAWRALLPSLPRQVVMAEIPGGPRLFFLATEGGDLLAVDEDGTLVVQERLPEAVENRVTPVYGLSAGEFRPGHWGVVVDMRRNSYVYSLHPERVRGG
jgi:hypothetical protein